MCGNENCKYKVICELYEDHYGFGRCGLDILGEKEMERKLKWHGLDVDKVEKECYDNIKEDEHE